jgi:hypothetical protein
MSLFETLKKAIFYNPMARGSQDAASTSHTSRPATPASSARPASAAPSSPAAKPAATAAPASQPVSKPPPAPSPTAVEAVDVEAVLEKLNAQSAQKLNWRTSIVDLMKLVGLDSSLQHRKELATELGYSGDMNDSAAMNIWLHKAVMRKLADNGGKVPASLQ